MIRSFNGKSPKIAESAFVSEWAYVVGDVEIGAYSGVWPGAVIRGDFGTIRIGRDTHIEDNSVLHAGTDMDIGDNVIIGHGAVVHCRRIGNGVLVGNNATLLDQAEIGDSCIVGANSMVATGQKVPPHSLMVGTPARVKRKLPPEGVEGFYAKLMEQHSLLPREDTPRLTYSQLAQQYKKEGL
jgi:carbonic anhydrase/acetyltransferase-like protein (isoleucine patch superfamily)